jgi:hypothetical protein
MSAFLNIRLPAPYSHKGQTIWNAEFDEKAIRAEASVVIPLMPPITHRRARNKRLDVSAELHIC